MDVGTKIKEIRKDKGLTQKQLAEKAHLSVASIQGYEQKKYKPKIETIEQIANALDVSISALDPDLYYTSTIRQFASVGDFDDFRQSLENKLKKYSENDLQALRKLDESHKYEKMLINRFDELNDKGKEKAIEQVELLTKIPEYKNDPDQDQEN